MSELIENPFNNQIIDNSACDLKIADITGCFNNFDSNILNDESLDNY